MLLKRSQLAFYGLILALSGAAACGDDDEGENDGNANIGGTIYTASVTDSSSDRAVGGLTVHVLDNQTGMKTGQNAVTDSNGRITLNGVVTDSEGKFAVLVEGKAGETGYLDTFQYNLDPNAKDDILRTVASGAIGLATAAANFDANPEKGPISGAIFTGTGSADRVPADCLTIQLVGFENEPMKTGMKCAAEDLCIRYFFDQRIPDFQATHTSAANGRFFIANASAGKHTLKVLANGTEIASTSLVVTPRNQGTNGVETISVANIFLGAGDTNPVAGMCQ